jgi:iron complex outermembrane recepter protein
MSRSPLHVSPVALATMLCLGFATISHAQDASSALDTRVQAPKSRDAQARVSGLGDVPAWQAPVQAARYDAQVLKQAQVKSLADLTTLDASVSDAYNAGGYWSVLSVRGFELDLTQNHLREGLPISAEAVLPLSNKSGVEVFKGTSGLQAGVSAPGGLVNLLVKRPQGRIRSMELGFESRRTLSAGFDLGDRAGAEQQVGWRVHGGHQSLRPNVTPQDGHAHQVGLAADWRIRPGTLLEIELEHNRSEQFSAPGHSLHGLSVPSAESVDPDLNLNRQAWSAPVTSEGSTGSIRLTHRLSDAWQLVGTYGEQHLRMDDRTAFPFGCAYATTSVATYIDRFCDDGTHDIYDYRSIDERRITRAHDLNASGTLNTPMGQHELRLGLSGSRQFIGVPTAAFDLMGLADSQGNLLQSVPGPLPSAQNVRQQTLTSLYLQDTWRINGQWTTWAGVRSTRMNRTQSLSDGSVAPTVLKDSLHTPWLAVGYQLAPQQQVYASWGEGAENLLAPFVNFAATNYLNPGSYLPAVKSRQVELGYKGQWQQTFLSLNAFVIKRPQGEFITDGTGATRYQLDGVARHQGLEATVSHKMGAWQFDGGTMWLKARREGSQLATVNGKAPANVPDHTVRLATQYRLPDFQRASLSAAWVHEGRRLADVANGLSIPSWQRIDLGAQWAMKQAGSTVSWSVGIKNLLDTRAWRESPNKFNHLFLIPMPSRTLTVTALADF